MTSRRPRRRLPQPLAACTAALLAGAAASGQDLAEYFGFEGLEIVKVGRFAGPLTSGDVDGDGLVDLIIANNRASRIELHLQKRGATPDDEVRPPSRLNEFPEHWRFRRVNVPVAHQVGAIAPYDFDGDGRLDLIYIGSPSEIVFVRQVRPGTFDVTRKHSVRRLAGTRDGLAVADVLGDGRPELLAIASGAINIWPLDGDLLGEPTRLIAGDGTVAFLVADFDGNGRLDVCGILPTDPAPVRLWFGELEDGRGILGAQHRFEVPFLREAEAVRVANEPAARLATIELDSKRLVLYATANEQIAQSGDRDASLHVHSFNDPGNRNRRHVVIDVDGDGLLDLVATDTAANALVVYRQLPGKGLQAGVSHPCLSDLSGLVAGNVDDDPQAELFVLSEKEGVVGRCDVQVNAETGAVTVPFPAPLAFSPGNEPTTLGLVTLERGQRIAIVTKDGRDYVLDLLAMDGELETIPLGKLSRAPEHIIDLDADQDGRTDLLLFTREKPMTMLYATDEGFQLTESKDMRQYGLVKAAQSDNIAVFDVDGDGEDELLIADSNFVRAVRYEPQPADAAVSPGWQVVEQINASDSASKLVSMARLDGRVVAADRENERLLVLGRDEDGRWHEQESLSVRGFSFNAITAGAFSGAADQGILAVGDDGFAVIRLIGERTVLKEVASWRSSDERRLQHEIAVGDVNGDGFTDLVTVDAGEQMCEIFTFSEQQNLLYATGFQVFESQIFSGGDTREFEPSQVLIADVTGDGADDLVLLAHDRILIYPQMTEP